MRKISIPGLKIYGFDAKLTMYPLMKLNVSDAVLPRNTQSVVAAFNWGGGDHGTDGPGTAGAVGQGAKRRSHPQRRHLRQPPEGVVALLFEPCVEGPGPQPHRKPALRLPGLRRADEGSQPGPTGSGELKGVIAFTNYI